MRRRVFNILDYLFFHRERGKLFASFRPKTESGKDIANLWIPVFETVYKASFMLVVILKK